MDIGTKTPKKVKTTMSDTDRCSREELDRVIEWLLEVQNEDREKLKDEDAAYELIMWFYKVYAYKIPDNIYTDDFLTAWNEYIDKYPARTKVMFAWDQFISLSQRDRSILAFCWEVNRTPYATSIAYGAGDAWEDEEGMWDYYDMFAWLLDCASPHFLTLEPGDPTLQEYIQTGRVKSCPHCGCHDIQAYGYAFKTKGSVLFICPKCGAIGRHYGLKLIHKHADPKIIRIWPDMWDDDFYSDPYPFEGPERKPPVPEDYGLHEKNGE
jgi:hypothetical protein